MAFKKVSTARKYFKFAECKPGDKLVDAGIYVGPEEGRFGIQHIYKQTNGEIVCLNSSGHLNWLMENHVKPGQLVNVYYADKVMLTKGAFKGKEAHNFEVEIDDEHGVSQRKTVDDSAVTDAALASARADAALSAGGDDISL